MHRQKQVISRLFLMKKPMGPPPASKAFQFISKVLDDTCDTLATAHTCRDHSIFLIQSFQIVQVLYGEFTAGTTEGVTKCYSASVNINLLWIEACFPDHSD